MRAGQGLLVLHACGEDFDPEFYASENQAQDEWTGWAVEGTELEAWDDLDDEELEDWGEKLGLKAAP